MQSYYEDAVVAENYVKYRPYYNDQVKDIVLGFLSKSITPDADGKFDLLIDVGCGSGQVTKLFAPQFKKVLASDVSKNQIQQAKRHNEFDHVTYTIGAAEEHPNVADGSVDLLISAEAAHWFDHGKFFKEVFRTLKPGGVIALMGYESATFFPKNFCGDRKKVKQDQLKLGEEVIGAEMQDRESGYRSLYLRYQDLFEMLPTDDKKRNDDVVIQYEWGKQEVAGYLRSLDIVDNYLQKKYREATMMGEEVTNEYKRQVDPVPMFVDKLAKQLGFTNVDEPKFVVDVPFEIFVVMGRKHLCI